MSALGDPPVVHPATIAVVAAADGVLLAAIVRDVAGVAIGFGTLAAVLLFTTLTFFLLAVVADTATFIGRRGGFKR